MIEKKKNRTAEILHRLAAEFIRDYAGRNSLITITRVNLSLNGKELEVFFSVLPEEKRVEALQFLKRKTPEFYEYVREKSVIHFVPIVKFQYETQVQ